MLSLDFLFLTLPVPIELIRTHTSIKHAHVDGLVQESSNYIAHALELPTSPSISWTLEGYSAYKKWYTHSLLFSCTSPLISWTLEGYSAYKKWYRHSLHSIAFYGLSHFINILQDYFTGTDDHLIAPVPGKQPWERLHNTSNEFTKPGDNTATAKQSNPKHIEGILLKGPYLPCLHMAGRALLAGYHRHMFCGI